MKWFKFCWHEWSTWSGSSIDKEGVVFQFRKCIKCNKIQIREI